MDALYIEWDPAAASIELDKTSETLNSSKSTVTLTATVKNSTATVTWTSSDDAVATVAADADDSKVATVTLADGVTTGTATITATLGTGDDAPTATCTVTVSSHEHNWGEGTVSTPATCTEAGVRTFTCTGDGTCPDGGAKTEPITALGHNTAENATAVADVAATCTADGLTGKKICGRNNNGTTCQEVVVAGTATPRTGHLFPAGSTAGAKCTKCDVTRPDKVEFICQSTTAGQGVADAVKGYVIALADNMLGSGDAGKATIPGVNGGNETVYHVKFAGNASALDFVAPGDGTLDIYFVVNNGSGFTVTENGTAVTGSPFTIPAAASDSTITNAEKFSIDVTNGKTYEIKRDGNTQTRLAALVWEAAADEGDELDLTALNAAITAAEKLDTTLPTSTDGSDIDQDKTWVTEKMKTDLTSALTAAKAVAAKDDATQTEVDDAKTALDTAVKAYVPAAGTKPKTMNPTVADYNKPYDGKAHGISIASDELPTGATVTYCDTEDGTYAATPITITNVADSPKTVYYKVNAAGYAEFAGSATITITKAAAPTITVTPDLSEGIPAEGGKVTFTATGVPEGTLTGHCTQADADTNINFTMTNGKLQGVSNVAPNATDEAKTHTVSFTWADHPNYENATIADVTLTQVKQGEVGTTKATGLAVDNKFAAKGVTATAADDNGVAITIDEAGILAAFAEDKTAFTADGVKHGSDAYIMVSFDAPTGFDKATWKVQQTVSKDGVKGTPGAMWDWAENSTSGNELDVVGTDKIGDWFCVLKGVTGETPAMPDAATYRMEYKFFDSDDNHVATVYYMVERAVTAAPVEYTVTVTGGTADKAKATEGADVTVTAGAAPTGKVFDKWTTSDLTLSATDAAKAVLTFTMPAKNVALTATYKDDQGGEDQPTELVEGEYRMSNKDNGSATVNCADGVIAGLTWNDGAAVGSSGHGVESVTGFTVKVPDGKTATLTLITCVYGTGAPITCTSGTATVGEAEAITGSEQDKDMKTVITGVTGTAQFAMTGSAYVHYVKVELEAGGNQPGETVEGYILDANDLEVTDNTVELSGTKWGTDGFFEVCSTQAGKPFTPATAASFDGKTWDKTITLGGGFSYNSGNPKAALKFTVDKDSTVKVWWANASTAAVRNLAIYNSAGELVKASTASAEGATAVENVFSHDLTPGTYYLGSNNSSINIYRVEVTDKAAGGETETVDKTALTAALAAAKAIDTTAVKTSADGTDVPTTEKWVTAAVKDALTDAIAAAEALGETATQAQVDAATKALTDATAAWAPAAGTKTEGEEPKPANKTALQTAITNAEKKVPADIYVVGEDTKVSEVNYGTKFMTEPDKAAYDAALAAAKALLAKDDATQAEVDAAVTALNKAAAKVKNGTKGAPAPSGGSTSRGEDAAGTTTETKADGSTVTTTTDRQGNKTVVTQRPDGSKITAVTKADGTVTIAAVNADGETVADVKVPGTMPTNPQRFVDVPDEHWAAKSINDMAVLGVVRGVDDVNHIFDMKSDITRGSVATILFRFSNGKAGLENVFSDVAEGKWYTDGVAWASKVGVVNGFEDGTFKPENSITRAQLATMIARYAKIIGLDTTTNGDLSGFVDGNSVQSWAVDGMAWCVANGIVNGRGNNTLAPNASASRAEAAAMFDRFVQLLK